MPSVNRSALACLVILVVCAAQVRGDDVLSDIAMIKERLEAFALNFTTTSGLTFADLERGAQAYNLWPLESRQWIRSWPLYRLMIDFAILPMKHVYGQISDDPNLIERHLSRVERAYKHFRPGYMGEQVASKSIGINSLRVSKLYKILSGRDETKLTLKHFEDALAEATTWKQRLEELVTNEDIFASLQSVEDIINMFHSPGLKPLFDHVFPIIHLYPDPEALKAIYLEKMWTLYRRKFVDGQLIQIKS